MKNRLDDYSILIIYNDMELARQLTDRTALEACPSVFTTTVDDIPNALQNIQPHVIIVEADHGVLEEITSSFDEKERPIVIAIHDYPSRESFALADHVIPTSYLPFIDEIIIAQIIRSRPTLRLEAENQQLNRQLHDANQTKAEINILKQAIVHSVSHELRTPMLQVKSAVALLSEDESTNRNIIELATEATTRLEGGIRNVTLLNELMNESSDADSFTLVPVIQIIQAAIRNLGRSWEHKKNIERVDTLPCKHSYTVLCDRQRMTIAIQLLVDNALKFSHDKVKIKAVHSGNKLTISIQDRGIGIPPDQLERIFEPFYQIDGSSTRRFGGMGIGLAIVQLILEQHCAAIRVDSIQGKGSTFSFDLLLQEA